MNVGRLVTVLAALSAASAISVGRGIADMTGPAMEVNLMGYANPAQVAGGIHTRLFARAFVFDDGSKRFAYVSADIGMGSDLLNQKVVERLDQVLGSGVYTYDNLAISGTHTHSSPAGFLQYVLFQATSWGFMNQTFTAYVDGVAEAVIAAHNDLQPSVVTLSQGELEGANINRSPTSYVLNPDAEEYDADTDLNMLLLSIEAEGSGEPLGVLNWFAVHGTSLNNTNRLLSSDNRGYASYLLEQHFNGPTETVWPGQGPFVAAFASTNLGDVSPNTNGAKCIDTGLPCDAVTSTCNGRNELCIAFGPGVDMYDSAEIIGRKQFDHALDLVSNASQARMVLDGPVDFVHSFVNMSAQLVTVDNGDGSQSTVSTCRPAMGYAFAAGTTDGPGAFNFHQATNETTLFWQFITDVLNEPSPAEVECHAPKPILLNIGAMHRPYQWDAEVVPVQLLRLGFLFIASVPSEFTTMAGRRLRSAIKQRLLDSGLVNAEDADLIQVAIAGLANSYSDYVTTYEEYQAQRYEAASTIFGPHTHQAYVQLFEGLVDDMAASAADDTASLPASTKNLNSAAHLRGQHEREAKASSGKHAAKKRSHHRRSTEGSGFGGGDDEVAPPDLSGVQLQAIPDQVQVADSAPSGSSLGDLVVDVDASDDAIVAGSGAAVSATWWGANPRSDLKRGGTFCAVERLVSGAAAGGAGDGGQEEDSWVVVATDNDFATRFAVERPSKTAPKHIHASVWWQVPSDAVPGTHRLRYFGVATTKSSSSSPSSASSSSSSSMGAGAVWGTQEFEGVSSTFEVAQQAVPMPPSDAPSSHVQKPKDAGAPAVNSPLPLRA